MEIDWRWILEQIVEILSSPHTPSWVQAIGSLIGLWVAYKLARLPITHAAKTRRETIFAIAEAAHFHALNIRKAMEKSSWLKGGNFEVYRVYDKSLIVGIVGALQSVPMYEIGKSRAIVDLLSLTNQFVFLGNEIEEFLAGPYKNEVLAKSLGDIDPNDYEQRGKLAEAGYSALKSNVINRLKIIDANFASLKKSLTP